MGNEISADIKKLIETKEIDQKELAFFNNIRWVLTIFVVLIHLNVTYSTFGKWYYTEPWAIDFTGLFFAMYGMLSQAYVLGLFFFIAGYFTPSSVDKRGIKEFIRSRTIRLGIPTLVYMLCIHPITIYILQKFSLTSHTDFVAWYSDYILSLSFLSNSGPLWFTIVLLAFSISYALSKSLYTTKAEIKKKFEMKNVHLFSLILITALLAFLIRLFQPAGTTLFNNELGNFMQIGFFSSYITLYYSGILFYRYKLLEKLNFKFGMKWLVLTILVGVPLWFIVIISGDLLSGSVVLFGGFGWQSGMYSLWESFLAVGMTIGLIALFKEKFNSQGQITRFLGQNSFAVFVFHPPILVLISILMSEVSLPPLGKMYVVATLVIPTCYIFSHFFRKITWIKKYFS
ncbi:acyltransferase family protein [Vibrio sp. DW001]|uniref:acyltransferase family protein n=1 Tax=Vibrio sp. DW001 TaxID=2912315 RepID=UPI0023AF3909|nr:acyltransferase family protein [Vibrio sp. DW001]WED25216.1 acyltransferase family protein [Vibrio sp. DW001]